MATPWRPIGPDRMIASPGGAVRRRPDAVGDQADAGRVHEQPVGGAAAHDLRVAGNDPRARPSRRSRSRHRDRGQILQRESFLDDVGEGDREGLGAHHREVVDRAVDGQLADVAAGELDRAHHQRIGGAGHARPGHVHDRCVVERAARGRRGERGPDDVAQERVRELAAGAVAQDHPLTLGDRGRAVGALGSDRRTAAGDRRARLRQRRGTIGCSRRLGSNAHRGASPTPAPLIGPACTNGVTGSGERAPPSPRPAEKNAAQVPSELTIGAPSGFWGVHSVP